MKKRVVQILVVSLFVITCTYVYIFYENYTEGTIELDEEVKYVSVYGNSEGSIQSFSEGSVIFKSMDYELNQKDSFNIKNTVLGEQLDYANGVLYIEHFDYSQIIEVDGLRRTYRNTLDDSITYNMRDNTITGIQVTAEENVYYSLMNVKIETTVNHTVDASVMTIIQDNIRYDIFLEEKVDYVSYDEINNKFYMFNIAKSKTDLSTPSTIGYYEVVFNKESSTFELNGNRVSFEMNASRDSLAFSSKVKDGKVDVIYHSYVKSGSQNVYDIHVLTFDLSTNELEKSYTVDTLFIPENIDFDILEVLVFNNDYYITYTHSMIYTTVNLKDYQSTHNIVTGTGFVSRFSYSNDLDSLYMIAESSNDIRIFKLNEGNILSEQGFTKAEVGMGIGPIGFKNLYDFEVLYSK